MNKLAKASIAAAIATALLLGGAGTLASWNSSAGVSGGTVVAGNLLVADDLTPGAWTANGTSITLAGYLIVPGDVLTLTKTMNITATGNNLIATLAVDPGSISGTTALSTADTALASYLTKTAVVAATGTGLVASGASYIVTAGPLGVAQPVTVTVTLTFPKSPTSGLAAEAAAKSGSVSLAGLTISLTQN